MEVGFHIQVESFDNPWPNAKENLPRDTESEQLRHVLL